MKKGGGLHISETLSVNCVFWIQSLPDEEQGPSRRITEDLDSYFTGKNFPLFLREASDRSQLDQILSEILDQVNAGLRPILFFDMHGSKDSGLALANVDQTAPWEWLVERLRSINVASQNNLICIFGVCFGYYLNMSVELSKPTPSYITIAPEREVSFGFLEDNIVNFFKCVEETHNITSAYRKHLSSSMRYYHCQGVFAEALARYVAYYCRGRTKRERVEQLITISLSKNGGDVSKTRKWIKGRLKPDAWLIAHFAKTFLIGRPAAFDFDQVEKLAAGIKKSSTTPPA